jgi:GT2 family glycosyltransferase
MAPDRRGGAATPVAGRRWRKTDGAGLRLSVIVPARNAGPGLAACLAALAAGSQGATPGEIIVVDDGSTDETAAVARAHGALVIHLDGRGPAAARNAGARAARGDVLVFLDADCVPEAGCLEALVRPFADRRVAGVRGGYTTAQRALLARFTQLDFEEKQARMAASPEITVVDTACAAYRRSVFSEYGGFDERYRAPSAEDVELSFRMAAQGEQLVFAPNARVRHRHPDQLGRYLWRKLRFGYYRAQLYGRYPARLREDGYTPRLMPLQIGLASLLSAAVMLSRRVAVARPLTVGTALAFLGASFPLSYRAWRTDRSLVGFVPPLLLVRSLAQGLGLVAGLAVLGGRFVGRRGVRARPGRAVAGRRRR